MFIRYTLVALVASVSFCYNATRADQITLSENFTTNPTNRGWSVSGDSNLFQWVQGNGDLKVTWDSSKPNSYFACPIGRTLDRMDSFELKFDLWLDDFACGVNPAMPDPFQIAVGLVNLSQATNAGFVRGSGYQSPNLIEFSFFPDAGGTWQWGPSLTAVMIDRTGFNWGSGGFAPSALISNEWLRVTMAYDGTNQTLRTGVTHNGTNFALLSDTRLGSAFQDFQIDHLAIASFSEAGQDPAYAGSILAHGRIDNLVLTVQPPGIGNCSGMMTNGVWQTRIHARTNWSYTLERSTNFVHWTEVTTEVPGTGAPVELQDMNPPTGRALYRVRSRTP